MKKNQQQKKVIYIIGITNKHKEILSNISKYFNNIKINSFKEELNDIIYKINRTKL